MNKSELIKVIARRAEVPQSVAGRLLEAVLFEIAAALARGGQVRLQDFGTFEVVGRRPRKARDPRTGQAIVVPARRAVRFRPGAGLRRVIAG